MKRLIFQHNSLEVWEEDGKFFALYDAGSHMIKMRKDEISMEEAKQACSGVEGATAMLFSLQERLIEAGINPYESNAPLRNG